MSAAIVSHGGTMPAEWHLMPPDSNPRVMEKIATTEGGKVGRLDVLLGHQDDGLAIFIVTEQPHPAGGELPSIYVMPLHPLLAHMIETIALGILASRDEPKAAGDADTCQIAAVGGRGCEQPDCTCRDQDQEGGAA